MSVAAKNTTQPFVIRRYSPEELQEILIPQKIGSIRVPARSYNITNDEQRFLLVQKVLSCELSLSEVSQFLKYQAAEAFKISYSTAKAIVKIYKKEGRVEKKKKRLVKGYAKKLKSKLNLQPIPSAQSNEMNYESNCNVLQEGFWANSITSHLKNQGEREVC